LNYQAKKHADEIKLMNGKRKQGLKRNVTTDETRIDTT